MNATPERYRMAYVSAPCGSGKTYAVCQYIKKHQQTRNHLYVAPTKILIEATAKEFRKLGIEPKVITSDHYENNVTKTLVDYLLACEERGEVLLITFLAYTSLPYFNRQDNWNVFIDEVPQLDIFYPLDLHQNPNQIFEHIVVGSPINDSILPVSARNNGRLKKLLENPDDITKKFKPFFRDILNPNKDVFVCH